MSDQRRIFIATSRARLAACLTLVWLVFGCGSDPAEHATFVSPQFEETCDLLDCSDVGTCALKEETEEPYCECPSGYAGEYCEVCDTSFHRDALWHCVPDRRCAEQPANPCGAHGDCKDDAGVIACACKDGYQGARCSVCAQDYVKSAKGQCLKKVLEK